MRDIEDLLDQVSELEERLRRETACCFQMHSLLIEIKDRYPITSSLVDGYLSGGGEHE